MKKIGFAIAWVGIAVGSATAAKLQTGKDVDFREDPIK